MGKTFIKVVFNSVLSTFLLSLVTISNIPETQAEVLDHSILHKDGSFTPANVTPHKDITEVEQPMEFQDATKLDGIKNDNKSEEKILNKAADEAKNGFDSNELNSEKPSSALNYGETKNSLLKPDESKYSEVPNNNKVTKNQQEDKIELPSTGVKGNLNSPLVATVLLIIGSAFLFKGICSILIRKVN
ncbi:LPXTG cell wall anchor domain-containing protein [Staphylococcus shinii]|uniref:LPXTG cell wall anchor domain-containing protein n=1 Tax=Staphylococcus shinii TaxID=2912228 RepID=UPI003F5FCD5E